MDNHPNLRQRKIESAALANMNLRHKYHWRKMLLGNQIDTISIKIMASFAMLILFALWQVTATEALLIKPNLVTLNRTSNEGSTGQLSTALPTAASMRSYSNHSVVKILERNIHLLFASNNSTEREHGGEHEVLWFDKSDPNASYAYVRLDPIASHRVKRHAPRMGGPVFITRNLQSWIDGEHYSGAPRDYRYQAPKFRHVHDTVAEVDEDEIDNIGTIIREPSSSSVDEVYHSKIMPSFVLNRYHTLDNVNRFLEQVEARNPGVTVFTIGYTHENRPIKAIEVLNKPSDRRFVWIDACTHAREWVTVTTALYLIEQVIIHKVPLNFVIVPVLNVDGYLYTWTKDRMWRKNRRPYTASQLASHSMPDRCNGVDLNRNYDINFGGEGSSTNPCSFLYQGPFPFSEPEVRAASELLDKNRDRIKMTLSLHSFNQLWASPNAFTTAPTKHHQHHMQVLSVVQKAVYEVNGIKYDVGPLGASLYLGSGFMMDWIYHKLGIRDAYLVELRDKGFHGFILPVDQILPTATETWAGLRAALRQIFHV